MADPTKEERRAKLQRFLDLAGVKTLAENPTSGKKVIARDPIGKFAIEINPFLGTCELIFPFDCKLDQAERARLTAIANEVGAGHEFYSDKYSGMSPDEAANWGKGTARESHYSPEN